MEPNLTLNNYYDFLPRELQYHILTYVNDVDSLRKVSIGCRNDVDNRLCEIWCDWKANLPEDSPIRFLMHSIECTPGTGTEGSVNNFKSLTASMNGKWKSSNSCIPQNMINRFNYKMNHLSFADKIPLLSEGIITTKAHNVPIIKLWQEIEDQLLSKSITLKNLPQFPSTANEIRAWLSNPANKEYLGLITELNLSKKDLKELPPEIHYLSNLQSLNLSENRLDELPKELAKLEKLKSLVSYNNYFTVIPDAIFECKGLKTLWLGDNRIRVIPPKILQLKNLTSLNLRNNFITTLPAEIRFLEKLEKLDCSLNRIQQIPAEIKYLVNLQELDLHINNIQTIPREMRFLISLQSLDLGHNEIERLPPEILYLQQLKSLNMSTNKLVSLPIELRHLLNLTNLIISYNNITDLPPEIGEIPLKTLKAWNTLIPPANVPNSLKSKTDICPEYLRYNSKLLGTLHLLFTGSCLVAGTAGVAYANHYNINRGELNLFNTGMLSGGIIGVVELFKQYRSSN